ncbi:DUF7500 family protein [Halobaculum limi]|uniref:DUF7500 family protein n=1 Tax=Halobaculum limi TaxID=3031916 RepID=UPI0024058DFE|nr:hypothetical protein [Halobaculum sp. YSMS11]
MSDDAPRGNPGVDPDDLDISKSEYVRELGDDRYVVSPGRRPPPVPQESDVDGDAPERRPTDSLPSADDVREGLAPEDAQPSSSTDRRRRESSRPADSSSPESQSSSADAAPASRESPRQPSGPAGSDDGLPTDPTASSGDDAAASDSTATQSADPSTSADRPTEGTSDRPASHERRGAPRGGGDATGAPVDLDAGAVGQWLAASLADTEFSYGFDATLSLDGRTARHRMASDDVGETFETLVTWFADAAGGDTPPEDALGILLAGMDEGPRIPPNAVRAALARLGLSRDDTVEDLLTALDRAGGLQLK